MPHCGTIKLANGTTADLEMPDLYAVLATVGSVPSPDVAAVLRLLEGTGALEPLNLLQKLAAQREYWMGLYQLALLCMARPKLRLDVSNERPLLAGEITPRDLTLNDVQGIYHRFFLGDVAIVEHAPDPTHVNGVAAPAPTGDDISAAAKSGRRGD